MLNKLTPEQISRFEEFRQRWLAIGLSTQPCDQDKAKASVIDAYQVAGMAAPRFFAWFDSPLSLAIGDSIFRDEKMRKLLEAPGDSVGDSVWASVGDSVWASVYGSHDAGWLSFYSYFREVCQLDCCEKLRPLMQLAEHCGWWIPRANAAFLSHKPIHCNVNARGVLHDDGRMAIEYRDGFGVYANDGVRLPEKYGAVKMADWKSAWLLEEQNAELRMVLIRGIGYERIFGELEAKKIDKWREYELHRIDNADVEPIVLLTMTCPSTGKLHCLRVPPDMKKARAAITACNKGIDPETFLVEH